MIPKMYLCSMLPKILVISNYNDFHTVRPEAEIYLGLARKGFEIEVMTYGQSEYARRFRDAGIKVIDFHPQKKFSRKESLYIRQVLTEGKHDILQLFNSEAIVTGIRAAKGMDVKVVLYRGYTGNIHWYDPTAYLKFLHPRVDKVICNSKGVEELLHRQLFFRNDKAVTINKGHRLDWYEAIEKIDLGKEYGIPEDAFVMACVANNRKMKGVPYLLKAFHHLPPGLPVHLLLLGRDMDSPSNLRIAESSAYAENIHFPGFIPDVLRTVSACDVFVLPSLFGESITKSVLEAMSLGLCPLITDIPGNLELVEEGKNGIVVPKKDSKALAHTILELAEDQEKCRTYGKASKQRIREVLNNERSIEGYARLYQSLFSGQASV